MIDIINKIKNKQKISICGLLMPFTLEDLGSYVCLGCGGRFKYHKGSIFEMLKNHWILCPNRLPIEPAINLEETIEIED